MGRKEVKERKEGKDRRRERRVQIVQSLELHSYIDNSWRHSLCCSCSGDAFRGKKKEKKRHQWCALHNLLYNDPSNVYLGGEDLPVCLMKRGHREPCWRSPRL